MYRRVGQPDFDHGESGFLAGPAGEVAEGIRRAILPGAAGQGGEDAPGVLMLDDGDRLASATAAARPWLEAILTVPPVTGGRLPDIVYAVVARARAGDHEMARARVPTVTGGWAVIHASLLEGDPQAVAVVIEPARQPELAGLVATA